MDFPIRPGYEGHLALSVAQVIIDENLQARGVDVDALLGGDTGRALLNDYRPENVAATIGLTPEIAGGDPAEFVRKLARDFAGHGPSIAIAGGSAGAHSNGLFNLEAAAVLNWLAGSVGAVGGVRLNPPGPWDNVPSSAHSASIDDMERLISRIRSGETRMLMLHNVDPVHGLPESLDLADAIVSAQDLFVVSFSPFVDDTTALADLLLAQTACTWRTGATTSPTPPPATRPSVSSSPWSTPCGISTRAASPTCCWPRPTGPA